MRRIQLKLTQTELEDKLGITFQQIQKYEKGTNRISGSRILQMTKALACDANYLLQGADTINQGQRINTKMVTLRLINEMAELPEILQKSLRELVRASPRK